MNFGEKIFIIGFNKCGTRAFHEFFIANGLSGVHWDNNNLALSMWDQISAGKDPIGRYPDVQVFSDMECVSDLSIRPLEIYLHFRDLYKWYPDATYILNTRSPDRWIISRIYHLDGDLLECWKHHYGTRDVLGVIDRWRQSWAAHHADVRNFFADKPGSYLEYNLDMDKPQKLSQHFAKELSLNPSLFKTVGKSNMTPVWEMGDIDEAIAAQHAVLDIDPEFAGAHGILSLIAERQGDRAKSLYHAEQANRLMPENRNYQHNLKRLQP